MAVGTLAAALEAVPDARRAQLRVHEVVPVLHVSVVAMLCGARGVTAIAQWARERLVDDPKVLHR